MVLCLNNAASDSSSDNAGKLLRMKHRRGKRAPFTPSLLEGFAYSLIAMLRSRSAAQRSLGGIDQLRLIADGEDMLSDTLLVSENASTRCVRLSVQVAENSIEALHSAETKARGRAQGSDAAAIYVLLCATPDPRAPVPTPIRAPSRHVATYQRRQERV